MRGLGDQIAVLDGLGALDPNDGRIGQRRARVDQYGRIIAPNVLLKRGVISAAGGANYSGGSAYAPGLPLMPSTIGLAGLRRVRRGLGDIPSVLPPRRGVIDPSGGANYTGGSSWTGGMPLTPSNAGLANALIDGGYGRAGLGTALIDGGYGRAGLGATGTAADEDLAAAAEAVAYARKLDPHDGRTGQFRARVDEYGRAVMPGVLERSNVIDPSEGANYSGGSSWTGGIPLTPSNAGLAGCACPTGMQGLGATPTMNIARMKARAMYNQYMQIAQAQSALMRRYQSNPSARNLYLMAQKRYATALLAACRLRKPAGLPATAACNLVIARANAVWR